MRGVRGGWFINDIIGLLWAVDSLRYISNNDEGAEVVVVKMLESTTIAEGRPTCSDLLWRC